VAVGALTVAVLSSESVGASAEASPAAATHTVMIQGYAFSPAALTVRVGDTVTWMNMDTAPHDVTSADGELASPTLRTGQTWSWTATKATSLSYICSIHPDMKATMTVTAVPAAAAVSSAKVSGTTRTQATPPAKVVAPAADATTATGSGTARVTTPTANAPKATAPQGQTAPRVVTKEIPATQPTIVTTTRQTVDPLLLVAAVAAGATVFCLLLLARRPRAAAVTGLPAGYVVVRPSDDREPAQAGR